MIVPRNTLGSHTVQRRQRGIDLRTRRLPAARNNLNSLATYSID
jgi:hypothetical protein